jgi:hypothetical protein
MKMIGRCQSQPPYKSPSLLMRHAGAAQAICTDKNEHELEMHLVEISATMPKSCQHCSTGSEYPSYDQDRWFLVAAER